MICEAKKPKFYPALRGRNLAARPEKKSEKSDFSRGDFRISVYGSTHQKFSAQELSSCYEEADPGLRRSAAARHHLEKEGQSSLGSSGGKPVEARARRRLLSTVSNCLDRTVYVRLYGRHDKML